MTITNNELVALGAILGTIGGCVHRICLTVERTWPTSKAAHVAAEVDTATTIVQQIAGGTAPTLAASKGS